MSASQVLLLQNILVGCLPIVVGLMIAKRDYNVSVLFQSQSDLTKFAFLLPALLFFRIFSGCNFSKISDGGLQVMSIVGLCVSLIYINGGDWLFADVAYIFEDCALRIYEYFCYPSYTNYPRYIVPQGHHPLSLGSSSFCAPCPSYTGDLMWKSEKNDSGKSKASVGKIDRFIRDAQAAIDCASEALRQLQTNVSQKKSRNQGDFPTPPPVQRRKKRTKRSHDHKSKRSEEHREEKPSKNDNESSHPDSKNKNAKVWQYTLPEKDFQGKMEAGEAFVDLRNFQSCLEIDCNTFFRYFKAFAFSLATMWISSTVFFSGQPPEKPSRNKWLSLTP